MKNTETGILSEESGSILLTVLVLLSVVSAMIAAITVYNVNQANYINQIRESYQMMTVTESLAKSAGHAVNLAAAAEARKGSPLIDGEINQCPDGGVVRLVSGKAYCLSGGAGSNMGQLCVNRPDTGVQVCSTIDFGQYDFKILNQNKEVIAELQLGSDNLIGSKFGKWISNVAANFDFGKTRDRQFDLWLNKNSGSFTGLVASLYEDKANGVSLLSTNQAYASASTCSNHLMFPAPPNLTGVTLNDLNLIKDYLAQIETTSDQLSSHGNCLDVDNPLSTNYLENKDRIMDAIALFTNLLSDSNLSDNVGTSVPGHVSRINDKFAQYLPVTSGGSFNGSGPWTSIRSHSGALVDHYSDYITAYIANGNSTPPPSATPSWELTKKLDGVSQNAVAVNQADVVDCSLFTNCATVVATPVNNASEVFVQNVFVVE